MKRKLKSFEKNKNISFGVPSSIKIKTCKVR